MLERLPVELMIEILQCLSPQEICRIRQVSHHTKTFVDENESALAGHHFRHHLRLKTTIAFLSDPTVDVIDAFVRHIAYHGVAVQIKRLLTSETYIKARQFYYALEKIPLMFAGWTQYWSAKTDYQGQPKTWVNEAKLRRWTSRDCDPQQSLETALLCLSRTHLQLAGPFPALDAISGLAKLGELVQEPEFFRSPWFAPRLWRDFFVAWIGWRGRGSLLRCSRLRFSPMSCCGELQVEIKLPVGDGRADFALESEEDDSCFWATESSGRRWAACNGQHGVFETHEAKTDWYM